MTDKGRRPGEGFPVFSRLSLSTDSTHYILQHTYICTYVCTIYVTWEFNG